MLTKAGFGAGAISAALSPLVSHAADHARILAAARAALADARAAAAADGAIGGDLARVVPEACPTELWALFEASAARRSGVASPPRARAIYLALGTLPPSAL